MIKIFELVKEIKSAYLSKYGTISYYYDDKPCIEHWIEELDVPLYKEIFENINVRQFGDYIILKYIKYEVLFTRNSNISYNDFWNLYDGIYRECRGITIDVVDDAIVTLPYCKFFNINEVEENHEKVIREKLLNAKVIEFSDKMDGSLIISRYYKNLPYVSSSGTADDSFKIVAFAKKCVNNSNYVNMLKDFCDYTFMFESIFEGDKHVVVYGKDKEGLYLTGMRSVKTGELMPYSEVIKIAKRYNVKSTEQYLVSFNEILNMRSEYVASEKEGFVMYIDGHLVKIKCEDYLMFHKLASAYQNKNNIIKALYYNNLDDLRSCIPEVFLPIFNEALATIQEYCNLMEIAVEESFKTAPTDKVKFFEWVKKEPFYLQRYLQAKYLGNELSYLLLRKYGEQVSFVKYANIEEILTCLKKS